MGVRTAMAWTAQQCDKGPMANMNVTPLIDVLLVLIITFMLVSPLTPSGLDAQVTHPARNGGAEAVVVTVDAAGNIAINQDHVGLTDLDLRLREIFRTRNDRTILLKCDPSLAFSSVAKVMDVANGAGTDRVGLVTDRVSEAH